MTWKSCFPKYWPFPVGFQMPLVNSPPKLPVFWCIRADSSFAPSQWETSLQSDAISHWLGAKNCWANNRVWWFETSKCCHEANAMPTQTDCCQSIRRLIVYFFSWEPQELQHKASEAIPKLYNHVMVFINIYTRKNNMVEVSVDYCRWGRQVLLIHNKMEKS